MLLFLISLLAAAPSAAQVAPSGVTSDIVDVTMWDAERFGEDETAPADFALHAPFPNPFRDATTLTYALSDPAEVRLEVFDALGRRVAMVVEGMHTAGTHEIQFVARDLTPGLYLVRLTAGDQTATRRLVHVP